MLALAGLRRKTRYFGTVYDSMSKQPLDPVIVRLVDTESNGVVATSITDLAGRFGFVVRPGTYRINVVKTNYAFPSAKVTGHRDEIFDNLYHGEDLVVSGDENVISPNIPMDPLRFDWNQKDKQRIILYHPKLEVAVHRVVTVLFWSGLPFVLWSFIANPDLVHTFSVLLYGIVLSFKLLQPYPRLWGKVYDVSSGRVIEGCLLEMRSPVSKVVLSRAKSAFNGKFFLKAQPGNYQLALLRPNSGPHVPFPPRPVKVGKSGMYTQVIALP